MNTTIKPKMGICSRCGHSMICFDNIDFEGCCKNTSIKSFQDVCIECVTDKEWKTFGFDRTKSIK